MKDNNIKVLEPGHMDFPLILSCIQEPVKQLYCIGDTGLLGKPAAAVVGARKCSEYGRQTALKIGRAMAAFGIVTVSGMAVGIDAAAHQGALAEGGSTIAVLGSGPDVCYPKANERLYQSLRSEGLIISEYPPGTQPKPWHFPKRNRIISAISEAVVVAEAGEGSGASITAVAAAEQGREVYAVPGNITSPYSLGANRLIRDGARIVTNIEELMLELGGVRPGEAQSLCGEGEELMGRDELALLDALHEKGAMTPDELCSVLGKSPGTINGLVTVMEMKGIISYSLGKIFIAKF